MHEIVKAAIFPTSISDCVIRLLLVVVLHILGLLSGLDDTVGRCAFNRNLNDGFNCGGAIDILPLRGCSNI